MTDNKQDFSKCKVGDKLWSIQLGECEVIDIFENVHTLECKSLHNNKRDCYFSNGGTSDLNDAHQSLFFSNPNIQAPPPTKRKVKKKLEGWVNIYWDREPGKIYRSKDGATRAISRCHEFIATVFVSGEYEVEE